MKVFRMMSAALIGGVMLCRSFASLAGAQEVYQVSAKITPQFTIEVDGEEIIFFDASGSEAQPIVYNGTTYLPVRAIGELMGKNVNWDQSALTVTIAGKRTTEAVKGKEDKYAEEKDITVQIRPDFTIVVEGVKRSFTDANGDTVYAMLYNGSTYLPLRAIGQIMGKNVLWTEDTQTISLYGEVSEELLVTDADTFDTAAGETEKTADGKQYPPQHPYSPANMPKPDFRGEDMPHKDNIGREPKPDNNGGEPSENNIPQNKEMLGEEAAKNKALEHAGLNSADNFRIKQKTEKGRRVYNIEFRDGVVTYEYDVDAYTGEIIGSERESKEDKKNNSGQEREYIGNEKAKSIALAEIDGASESDILKIKLDEDVYEAKILYDGVEYELEIDAYTGNILKFESEKAD